MLAGLSANLQFRALLDIAWGRTCPKVYVKKLREMVRGQFCFGVRVNISDLAKVPKGEVCAVNSGIVRWVEIARYVCKELCRGMSRPCVGAWRALKKLCR